LDSGVFEELKRLFSTTPKVGKETEANGGHKGDRTLDRTRSLNDQTRPVSVQCLRLFQVDDRMRSASDRRRSNASDRSGSLLNSNRTLALWHPVSSTARPVTISLCAAQTLPARPVSHGTSVSGHSQRVRFSHQVRPVVASQLAVVRPARPVSWTSASGQCFAT
jgi:hypothetical protein